MESYLVLAASLDRDVERSRVVDLNVANSTVPGFKRLLDAEVEGGGSINKAEGRNLAPGKPMVTGRPLDVFLSDGVYVALESADDETYSRGGHLLVDGSGRLMSGQGSQVKVEGAAGPLPSDVRVAADGRLLSDGVEVGRLVLVRAGRARWMETDRYQLDDSTAIERGVTALTPGAYEASNVQLTDEMVAMMRTLRHLESVQRVLKQEDGLNERLFSALAKF